MRYGPRDPTRRNIVTVGLGAKLRVKRQRNLGDVDQVIERAVSVFLPGAILIDLDQALEPNVPDARGHATRLHRQSAPMLVSSFDPREAANALLTGPGGAAVKALLVGACFEAFAVTAAAFLIDEDDAVFGPLVDRVARAGRQAGRVRAVIADARQIKEPGLVLRQSFAAFEVLPFDPFSEPVG